MILGQLEGKGSTKLTNGAWNPHQNCQQYATVNEHTVRGWDVRTMKQSWHINECFSTTVRAIDFNPNKQYQIATGKNRSNSSYIIYIYIKHFKNIRNSHLYIMIGTIPVL